MTGLKYHPFYCEENIWHLCHQFNQDEKVIFILNKNGSTKFYYQTQSSHPLIPIHWDYHVILVSNTSRKQYKVYDFDSYLSFPIDAIEYFTFTFNLAVEEIDPFCFLRIFNCSDFKNRFYSDRSHMLNHSGIWLKPPPPWTFIKSTANHLLVLKDIINSRKQQLHSDVLLSDFLLNIQGTLKNNTNLVKVLINRDLSVGEYLVNIGQVQGKGVTW